MGLYEWDPTTRELIWDDALAALFVADRRDELPLQTWLRRVHPDAQKGVGATFAEWERAENTYRLVLDDGSVRYVLNRVTQLSVTRAVCRSGCSE
jgi:PAS domain-containing protein